MKLLTKLTLFTTLSKIAIVLLFVWLLPAIVDRVAFQYANQRLQQQEKKVFAVIEKNGIDYYLQGDSTYGSYTMLKEEYISLEKSGTAYLPDTLQTSQRIVEGDTLVYRMLVSNFEYNGIQYTLEIGKTINSIRQYNMPLQRIALFVLAALVVLTLLLDLSVTRILLRPLRKIIQTKLVNAKFPFTATLTPIKTSTTDFRYLDESLQQLMHRITADFERERAFTSNASHELMTPVSVLQTKLENLMLHNIDETSQEKVLEMMKILNRLKLIVNALLLISRIENDQYDRKDNMQISQTISDITGELSARMEARDIALSVQLNNRICLEGVNSQLIFQLFYNLLTNAIRYNKEGGSISISDSYHSSGYELSIQDSGRGIPEEKQSLVFDRFNRSNLPGGEGTGLGLSIVRAIAQYHGLSVKLQSVPGQGSIFTVVFPAGMAILK